MFSSIRIALILVLLASAGGAFMYVKKLQSDLETARANVAKMEVAVQTSENSLKLIQEETLKVNKDFHSILQDALEVGVPKQQLLKILLSIKKITITKVYQHFTMNNHCQ